MGIEYIVEQAVSLQKSGRSTEALDFLMEAHRDSPANELILELLFELASVLGRGDIKRFSLERWLVYAPESLEVNNYLCQCLCELEGPLLAKNFYLERLALFPSNENLRFNFAHFLRVSGFCLEAIEWFKKCLGVQCKQAFDVYCQLGLAYSEVGNYRLAKLAYTKARLASPQHRQPLFNLAALEEEAGNKDQATCLYLRCLKNNEFDVESMTRLAYLGRCLDAHERNRIHNLLDRALQHPKIPHRLKVSAHFAKGKLLQDGADYTAAFEHFSKGNSLSRSSAGAYDPRQMELRFEKIKSLDAALRDLDTSVCCASECSEPVFIVGMFRSGTTLVEHCLSGFDEFDCRGELPFFHRELGALLEKDVSEVVDIFRARASDLVTKYSHSLQWLRPVVGRTVDKMPDNFLYLGLLLRLFPKAKFIYQRRDRRDVAWSIYSNQFSSALPYATRIDDILHYESLVSDLMDYFLSQYPTSIYAVKYETLVREPEQTFAQILKFLGVESSCDKLNYGSGSKRLVKTASVNQVREGVHTGAVGVYQNYKFAFTI